jgi:hypothetical protein
MEVNCQLHAPVTLTPKERVPGTHWRRGWEGPKIGLDAVKKREMFALPGIRTIKVSRM